MALLQSLTEPPARRPAEEPTSLVIIPSPPESVRLGLAPTLAIDRPGLRLWHKRDWQFPLPRAVVYVRIASPALRGDGRRVAMASLCRRLLLDALTEASYMADLAGIVYTVESGTVSQGLEFKVEGFSHKLPRLAELIFDCLAHLPQRVSEEDFSRVKEALMRRLRNLDIKPHKQVRLGNAVASGVPFGADVPLSHGPSCLGPPHPGFGMTAPGTTAPGSPSLPGDDKVSAIVSALVPPCVW